MRSRNRYRAGCSQMSQASANQPIVCQCTLLLLKIYELLCHLLLSLPSNRCRLFADVELRSREVASPPRRAAARTFSLLCFLRFLTLSLLSIIPLQRCVYSHSTESSLGEWRGSFNLSIAPWSSSLYRKDAIPPLDTACSVLEPIPPRLALEQYPRSSSRCFLLFLDIARGQVCDRSPQGRDPLHVFWSIRFCHHIL